MEKTIRKHERGKATLRQVAEELDRKLEDTLELIEGRGLTYADAIREDRQEFERKQFNHIVDGIVRGIEAKAGKAKVCGCVGKVRKNKLTIAEGAKCLGITIGKFTLLLEKYGLKPKELEEKINKENKARK